MSNDFMVDVETAALDDSAIVFCAAIVYFNLQEDFTFDELVERALYVKFDASEQKRDLGRKADKDTLTWWSKQSEDIREMCTMPSPNDMSAKGGLLRMHDYIGQHGSKNSFLWSRGSLDSRVLESLARDAGVNPILHYNASMDVRTAIRLTKDTCDRFAYCTVPGIDRDTVDKHNPIADCALDIMQLRYGV